MYTPAVTIVAAWISADTGVGPSIASGSQTYKRNLRRLARRAHQHEQADGRQQTGAGFDAQARDSLEYTVILQRAEVLDQQKQRDQESEVADAVGNERLLACVRRRRFQEPEADQQIRSQAHPLPADKHQQVVVCQHQRQHEKHEEVQEGEVAVVAAFMRHVADGEDVNHKAHAGDDQQHHQRQLVEPEAVFNREVAGRHPCLMVLDVGNLVRGQAEELNRHPNRVGESHRRRSQRDGVHQRFGKALTQQPVNSGSGQRQHRNDPKMHRILFAIRHSPFAFRYSPESSLVPSGEKRRANSEERLS